MTRSGSNATNGRTQAPLDLAAAPTRDGIGLGAQSVAMRTLPLRILVDRSEPSGSSRPPTDTVVAVISLWQQHATTYSARAPAPAT